MSAEEGVEPDEERAAHPGEGHAVVCGRVGEREGVFSLRFLLCARIRVGGRGGERLVISVRLPSELGAKHAGMLVLEESEPEREGVVSPCVS